LSSSNNQTTVEGEAITFECRFKGNYSPLNYHVYWIITLQNGSNIILDDDSNFPDYRINTYQSCLYFDTNSCCQFTTELSIDRATISLNDSMITCNAGLNSATSSSNASHLSELYILIATNIHSNL